MKGEDEWSRRRRNKTGGRMKSLEGKKVEEEDFRKNQRRKLDEEDWRRIN